MSLGKVSVAIEAQMAGFESDMGRAARVAEKNFKSMEKDAKRAQAQFKEFGKQVGVALVAAGTAAAVALKSSINAMDDMSKAAQKVGTSTEEFSKLTYAAGLADVSMETLVGSLGKLTKAQAASLSGTGEQAKIFEALGIAVKNTDGSMRESTNVLADFADRFQDLKGSPEAMAAGFSLFGRSFQEMIPLLKDGGDGIRAAGEELESFGGVLSTEAGQRAEQFNDNLTKLSTAAKALGTAVASDLLEDLVALTENWVQLAKDGSTLKETAHEIAEVLRMAGKVADFVWAPFKALGDVAAGTAMGFVGLAEAAKGVLNLDWDQIQRGMNVANQGADLAYYGEEKASAKNLGAYSDAPKASRKPRVLFSDTDVMPTSMLGPAVDAHSRQLRAALAGPSKKGSAGGRSSNREMPDFAKEARAELEKLVAVEAQARSEFEAMAAQLAGPMAEAAYRYAIEQEKLNDLAKTGAIDAESLAAVQGNLSKEYEAQKQAIDLQLNPYKEVNAAIEEQLHLLGLTASQQEVYNNLKAAGVKANSVFGQSIEANTRLLQEQRAAMEDQIGAMDAVRDAGAGWLYDMTTSSKGWKEATLDALDSVYKRLMQMISENLMDQLLGKQGDPGGGNAGGWLGNLFASFFGGTSNSTTAASDAGSVVDLFSGEWGFADGGYTGPGARNKVAGLAHAGEVVWSQDDVARGGGVANVESMRKGGGSRGGVVQNIAINYAAPYDPRTESQKNARLAYETGQASRRNN